MTAEDLVHLYLLRLHVDSDGADIEHEYANLQDDPVQVVLLAAAYS